MMKKTLGFEYISKYYLKNKQGAAKNTGIWANQDFDREDTFGLLDIDCVLVKDLLEAHFLTPEQPRDAYSPFCKVIGVLLDSPNKSQSKSEYEDGALIYTGKEIYQANRTWMKDLLKCYSKYRTLHFGASEASGKYIEDTSEAFGVMLIAKCYPLLNYAPVLCGIPVGEVADVWLKQKKYRPSMSIPGIVGRDFEKYTLPDIQDCLFPLGKPFNRLEIKVEEELDI